MKTEEIKKTTIKVQFIVCPNCNESYQSLVSTDVEGYLRDYHKKHWETIEKEKIKDKIFYCYNCGFIFDKEPEKWPFKEVEVIAYICPDCGEIVSKTKENFTFDGTGYLCPKCGKMLSYYNPHKHGTGEVEVKNTTDYFHGICPKCKKTDKYGMMVLRGEIIIGQSEPVKGRLILPIKCMNCGYEDAIKIATNVGIPVVLTDGSSPTLKIDFANPEQSDGTFFNASSHYNLRASWIAFGAQTKGKIVIDDGATKAILNKSAT